MFRSIFLFFSKVFYKILTLILAGIQLIIPLPLSSHLQWDENIISVCSYDSGEVCYPRLYTLDNGTILCGYTKFSSDSCSEIQILKSDDNGLTWSDSPVTASQYPQYNCDNVNFLQLKNGDILLAYRAIKRTADSTYTSLRVSISYDNAETWQDHSLIAEYTNSAFKGVWEPHMGYIGDKIAVFYANDSIGSDGVTHDWQQNIEYRIFENGKWEDRHIASDGNLTDSRDGMPVWCQLYDGSYAMVIEGTKSADNKKIENGMFIKLMLSKDGLEWDTNKAIDIYYPKDMTRTAGAPYIVLLPDGRIAVSFQTDEDSSEIGNLANDSGFKMKVMVSAFPVTYPTKIIQFTQCEIPFNTPENYNSVWNSMAVNKGYLFTCTSTNYPKSSIAIRRAKISK
jgi:hypothetical protein